MTTRGTTGTRRLSVTCSALVPGKKNPASRNKAMFDVLKAWFFFITESFLCIA